MRVCVIGGGAREHAIASTIAHQGHDVVVTPGNGGNPWSTKQSPLHLSADLFIIGPDREVVAGLADSLRAQGKTVFAPGRDGARIEGSKAWMKDLLACAGVPSADFQVVNSVEGALLAAEMFGWQVAIKTDGLAAGKGVAIVRDEASARADIESKMVLRSFGDAGEELVIEELLDGTEVSVMVICNGKDTVLLEGACDYKRLHNGDTGPNTGGMGAFSPSGYESQYPRWKANLIDPVVDELRRRRIDYRGVLYFGLMLTADGPKVLEINARFGDPEAQVILPRMVSDLAELLLAAAQGQVMLPPIFTSRYAVGVVKATRGYPERPVIGDVIHSSAWPDGPNEHVFFAGATKQRDGRLETAGGRVCTAVALAPSKLAARAYAYALADHLIWDGAHQRDDIAREPIGPDETFFSDIDAFYDSLTATNDI